MFRLTLPPVFWEDHYDRCASHDGVRNVVKQTKRYIVVELDTEALADLRSDADFYGGPDGPDIEGLPGLKASARATSKAILTQMKPNGEKP